MTRQITATSALLLAIVLAGCGSAHTAPKRDSPQASPSPAASAPAASPSAAAAATSATVCPTPAAAPITKAPGDGKTVALTFDDGPSPFTPQVLQVLARYHVHATFFDTGMNDTKYQQYAHAIVEAGDVLANHTWDHPKNWGFQNYYSADAERAELDRTTAVQTAIMGHKPCLMRPPGGAWDKGSLDLVRSLGMSLVMWSTDTEDWKQPPTVSPAAQASIVQSAESGTQFAHPVILMHDGKASPEPDCGPTACAPGQVSSFRGNTVASLPSVIEFYLAHGYTFVTM